MGIIKQIIKISDAKDIIKCKKAEKNNEYNFVRLTAKKYTTDKKFHKMVDRLNWYHNADSRLWLREYNQKQQLLQKFGNKYLIMYDKETSLEQEIEVKLTLTVSMKHNKDYIENLFKKMLSETKDFYVISLSVKEESEIYNTEVED